MPFGTNLLDNGNVLFQIQSLTATSVDLVIEGDTSKKIPLNRISPESFELVTSLANIGSKYQFIINTEHMVPDPASRWQPHGVHGPSQVIDPASYQWQDSNWTGRPWAEAIIYELHVGSYTPQGTFAAVLNKLDELICLGITAIELMPIGQFPGVRNWGYDGVLLFAPANCYGNPEDLKTLVDACHKKGLMIFLDVVYNHFGPEGNYLHSYAEYFFTDKYQTPWGKALNFDGPNAQSVRRFFVENALYWLHEFHFDGLRLDAVHTLNDNSNKHIVLEICETIRQLENNKRHIHIILENDKNTASFLERNSNNKPIFASAQWNDDFHHVFHVAATGESDGYYSDYAIPDTNDALLSKLGKALTEGFIFQGEISQFHDNKHRGEVSKYLPPSAFVSFLQNHDQIGNRAFGERLTSLTSIEQLRFLTAIFILCPQIPMLFMGEEWAASSPFFYFCDLGSDLAPLVTQGRRAEFKHFRQFEKGKDLDSIPDPNAIKTFQSSILNWSERKLDKHYRQLAFYQKLIEVRKVHLLPLLDQIVSGKAYYKVINASVLYAVWPLKDTRFFALLANFSNITVKIDPGTIPIHTKVLFQEPDGSYEQLKDASLGPKAVIWFLGGLQ